MASWWLPSRIDATVTRHFVVQQLVPEEIQRLDQPVAFGGEDLTERTYWDSIHQNAKRLFLILLDLGVPDQIFGIIDDGWDDAELPLGPEDVERLQLTAEKDDRIDRKFYQRQFMYLTKAINRGEHQAYSDYELVPLDVVDRPQGKAGSVDRVKLPNGGSRIFTRRRLALGNAPGLLPHRDFLDLISGIRPVRNEHIVSYWASYTHHGYGYILLTPTTDYTLKSFLANTPSVFKNLAKAARRELVMNWILCLADTMAFLHSKSRSHCCIKPSTILFTDSNHVFYADSTRLSPEAAGNGKDSSFDREWYDYAAPEQWYRPTGPGSPSAKKGMNSYSISPEGANFNIPKGPDGASSPSAAFHSPNPQLNPQQADIFSLGCIFLELLSFLVKRSTSKFASFRSAKHKTAGRGGAVLDTSFHKNLSQVEAWMSSLAKDASKKISDSDGGNVFRGITPMLHIITGMLSANPYDRPSAPEVQQKVYQVLIDQCDIEEPHCVHQYSTDLEYSLSRMQMADGEGLSQPIPIQHAGTYGVGPGTPRAFRHARKGSDGGYSEKSGTSNKTGSSSENGVLDPPYRGYPSGGRRGAPTPASQPSASGWAGQAPYMGTRGDPATLYASAR
jgi:serine/threonine protein kinase